VSYPNGVRGGATAENRFQCIPSITDASIVEMFVVNLHLVGRRLLMDKTLNIAFVRLEGDPGAILEENIGGGAIQKS